jgi:hypothetical protein
LNTWAKFSIAFFVLSTVPIVFFPVASLLIGKAVLLLAVIPAFILLILVLEGISFLTSLILGVVAIISKASMSESGYVTCLVISGLSFLALMEAARLFFFFR